MSTVEIHEDASQLTWIRRPASALAGSEARMNWNRLNTERIDAPFLDAASVLAALEAFKAQEPNLLEATRDGKTVAMFVLVRQNWMHWSTFQPSQIPLGAWVAADKYDLGELAASLLRSGRLGMAAVLSVTQVDPLQSARGPDGPDVRSSGYISTAWIDIAGTFDEYWAGRGKNLRQNLRKQRNKLTADGTPTAWRLIREPSEIAGVIARYGQLESSGWKGREGTAIHPDNAQGRYYFKLLHEAAGKGEALATEYLLDGRTVAMNFGLVRNSTWTVLKTAYDEAISGALSPASLLREEELRWIFTPDSGIRRIEYYGKVMDWHTKLTEKSRELFHLTCYRSAWVKRLAAARLGTRTQGG